MTEINPTPSQPTGGPADSISGGGSILPPNQTFQVDGGGGGWGAYKKWLGDDGYKQFQKMLCQNVSQQIGKDKQKEEARKQVMRKSIEGETDIFSP